MRYISLCHAAPETLTSWCPPDQAFSGCEGVALQNTCSASQKREYTQHFPPKPHPQDFSCAQVVQPSRATSLSSSVTMH